MDESGTTHCTVTRTTRSNAVVLKIEGAIDASTRRQARDHLVEAVGVLSPPEAVVIDLTTTEFFGSAGVHVLTDLIRACAGRALPIRLVAAPGTIPHRTLHLAALDLPTFTALDDALGAG